MFINKYNVDGNIVRCKTRLVAKECSQVLDEDYDKIYAAVVQLESLWITIAITAQLDLEI